MTATKFLNVDLDLESAHSIDAIITALGEAVDVLDQQSAEGRYTGSLELAECGCNSESGVKCHTDLASRLVGLCDLIEDLPADARAAWDQCSARVFNIGFACESGSKPSSFCSVIEPSIVQQVAQLGGALAVTIYRQPAGQ